jgi:hypothetical protein
VKDHIYEYTLTNTDNELYCYSNAFHSHLPFDRPWSDALKKVAITVETIIENNTITTRNSFWEARQTVFDFERFSSLMHLNNFEGFIHSGRSWFSYNKGGVRKGDFKNGNYKL